MDSEDTKKNRSTGIGFWAGIMLMAALVWGSSAWALHPPTPEQIEEYRKDGTLEARIRMAEELGNNKVDPKVAYDTQTRLIDLYEKSTGNRLNINRQPPPAWQGGLPTRGTVRIPIFLLGFQDYTGQSTGITFQNVVNKVNGAGDTAEFPYESVRNYYLRSSHNQLNISGGVYSWFDMAYPRPQVPDGYVNEGVILDLLKFWGNTMKQDFAQYDNDNDGTIDTLVILWAGPDNGWANFWWASQRPFTENFSNNVTVSGKKLKKYIWMWAKNEKQGDTDVPVKTMIHELGHALGLPDYYDYDEKAPAGGIGGLDMMAGTFGDHNCFSKFMLDWITPQVIASGNQSVVLNPSGTYQYGSSVLAFPNATNQIFSEYFMIQNRYRIGNDSNSRNPADGLLICMWMLLQHPMQKV
ncbi:MAG: M6 family metalloprotease domain-containing protein [Desulfobacteraceae bacterium]|nr:M6 family metalloprotease domain-containing protein [Desulfobacteraceae bacterium]